jgi:hypothetical protein
MKVQPVEEKARLVKTKSSEMSESATASVIESGTAIQKGQTHTAVGVMSN